MKLSVRTPYTLSLLGGMAAGLFLGDIFFPELEAAIGDPLGDFVVAAAGAAVASLIHDTLAHLRKRH
jgi:hypothetical protein